MGDLANDEAQDSAVRRPWAICARRGGLAVAGAIAACGLLFVWQASLLDLGHVGLPGPGFFPLVLGAAVAAFAVVIGLERWRMPADGQKIEIGHRDVLIVIAAMLGVPLLFEPLGAYLTLGLFGVVILRLVAKVSLPLAIAAMAAGMVGCWYFFEVMLGVQLPSGIL